MVQVLLDVEEGVEEDVGQLAPFEVPQGDLTWTGGNGDRRVIELLRNYVTLVKVQNGRATISLNRFHFY